MRALVTYGLLVGAPLLALLLILDAGRGLTPGLAASITDVATQAHQPHFLLTLLLQICVVLFVARAAGALFRRLHQPQVVGEMIAGVLLGPSLLGWAAPGISAALFPPESLVHLATLSQIGLVLFMFLVGVEFDPRLLHGQRTTAVVTSHVSIIAPFTLGAVLALYLFPRLGEAGVAFTGFALFMGAAMSITAFPVLARILNERNLTHTRLGAVTIACAAIDDVTAWSILAVVIAIVRSDAAARPLALTLAGAALFVMVMLFVVRRALGWLETYYHARGRLTQDMLAVILLLLLASAWTTEWLGIHALFGAFALGAALPRDPGLTRELSAKLGDVTVVFLLPLFFAFTGLRTSIGLITGAELWFHAALILLVAVAGKFGGSTLAARVTGLPWRESAALGVLMNTRGLMELVILTIGLELGVISPTLFTMMVLMALVTTLMTTPLLELIYPARLVRRRALGSVPDTSAFTTLIPVSLPSSGPGLLAVARALAPDGRPPVCYALHLHMAAEQSLVRVDTAERPGEERTLQPILAAARELQLDVRPLSFVTRQPGHDIADIADMKRADLILMGSHRPVFSHSVLGGTVHDVMNMATADVIVYIERTAQPWRRILVLHAGGVNDDGAVEVARRIAANTGAALTVLEAEPGEDAATVADAAVVGYDLIVAGVSGAPGLEPAAFGPREEQLARVATVSLIVFRRGSTQ